MKRSARPMFRGLVAVALAIAGGCPGQSVAAPASPSDPLNIAIRQLIERGLGPKPCAAGGRRSVALWAFEGEKVPVGPIAAKRLHEELLSRLLADRPKCLDVLDGAGINVIINHLRATGALENNGGSVIAALNETHQRVDLVIFPSLYNQSGRTVLTLGMFDRASGRPVTTTAPIIVPDKLIAQDQADTAFSSLEAAITAASRYLIDTAGDLRELRRIGFFFEGTSAQPPAGRYLLEQLIAALARDVADPVKDLKLKVRGLTIVPAPKDDGTVEAQALEPRQNDDTSVYDLTGRYWLRGNVVELRASLKRGDATTVVWQGSVRVSDFRDLQLRPTNPEAAKDPLPKTFAFQVTSPDGIAPVYRAGDELKVFMRVGEEASVYCFYVDSKGGVLPVLPNKFRSNTNRFTPKILHQLPDGGTDGFRLRFTSDTAGEELLACFASTREVRSELPGTLFPKEVGTVPFLTLDKVRQLFANLKNTKVSEASVTVTVAP